MFNKEYGNVSEQLQSAQTAIGLGRPLTITEATKMELDKAKAEVIRLEELIFLLESNPNIEKIFNLMRRY